MHYSPLISVEELNALRTDTAQNAGLVIVDVRHDLSNAAFGRMAYAANHIPSAIFLSIDDDLSAKKTGQNGRHPLPTAAVFAETLGRKGIANDSLVIAYDQGVMMYASRLWWMLRWLGHHNVRVLDGGLAQWQKASLMLEDTANIRPTAHLAAAPRDDMYLTVEQTLAALTHPERRVLDARGADRYRGEVEPIDPVAGHIPGAFNRPFQLNLQNGVFKPTAELRQAFEVVLAGRSPEHLIHQCGSGVSACVNLLAMEYAGLTGSKLYAGSWSEWCADPSRPVATNV